MGTSIVCQRRGPRNYLPCASVCISTSEHNGYWYVSLCIAYVSLAILYSMELTLATAGLDISTVTKSFLWLFVYFPISCPDYTSWLFSGNFGVEEVYVPTEIMGQTEVESLNESEKMVERFMSYVKKECKVPIFLCGIFHDISLWTSLCRMRIIISYVK